jgi:non-homologous end joining protein Ku
MAEIHREHDRGMTDEYRDALKHLIEQKIEHGDKAAPAPSKKAPTKKKAA